MGDDGQEETIKLLFPLIDKDGDGLVSKEEFRNLLKKLNDDEDEDVENITTEGFDKLDGDGNGAITFEELIEAFKTGIFQ